MAPRNSAPAGPCTFEKKKKKKKGGEVQCRGDHLKKRLSLKPPLLKKRGDDKSKKREKIPETGSKGRGRARLRLLDQEVNKSQAETLRLLKRVKNRSPIVQGGGRRGNERSIVVCPVDPPGGAPPEEKNSENIIATTGLLTRKRGTLTGRTRKQGTQIIR